MTIIPNSDRVTNEAKQEIVDEKRAWSSQCCNANYVLRSRSHVSLV